MPCLQLLFYPLRREKLQPPDHDFDRQWLVHYLQQNAVPFAVQPLVQVWRRAVEHESYLRLAAVFRPLFSRRRCRSWSTRTMCTTSFPFPAITSAFSVCSSSNAVAIAILSRDDILCDCALADSSWPTCNSLVHNYHLCLDSDQARILVAYRCDLVDASPYPQESFRNCDAIDCRLEFRDHHNSRILSLWDSYSGKSSESTSYTRRFSHSPYIRA